MLDLGLKTKKRQPISKKLAAGGKKLPPLME